MTWLTVLIVVVLIAAIAAVTGVKPKGSRPVARTQLMGVARFALILAGLVIVYFVWTSRP